MAIVQHRPSFTVPIAHGRSLLMGPRTLVMGIINVTPDSFAGGETDPDEAAALALRMEADGADIIDIGGESTRPGAEPVSAREERDRVIPVVDRLAGTLRIPMSIDTYKADVAAAAIRSGACIVNDISGLGYDRAIADVVARTEAGVVLMHTRGRPRDMYREAIYSDVAEEVAIELQMAVARATVAGIPHARIVLDPGLGFAKRAGDSWALLAALPRLAALDRPLLVGPSRKSFLTDALGPVPPGERDWGTVAAATAAALAGAHIVRVHAVTAAVHAVRVADTLRRYARR
jgi:dihydropteroate synthase